jgi:hypothetical protein
VIGNRSRVSNKVNACTQKDRQPPDLAKPVPAWIATASASILRGWMTKGWIAAPQSIETTTKSIDPDPFQAYRGLIGTVDTFDSIQLADHTRF